MDANLLTRAAVLWTGHGSSARPQRDDEVLVRTFGEPDGLKLLKELKALEVDFYSSDAHRTAPSLTTMGERAAAEFKVQHPDASDELVAAFAWCHTFDFK